MHVFAQDNFSIPSITFRPMDFSEGEHFTEVLNHYFTNYRVQSWSRLNHPEINSVNYKVVVESDGVTKNILLRQYKSLSDYEQIVFYLNTIETLSTYGVPVTQTLKSLNGEAAVQFGSDVFALFVFLEGEYFSPREDNLTAVAKALAQLHNGFDQLPPNVGRTIEQYSQQTNVYYNIVRDYSVNDFEQIRASIETQSVISSDEAEILKKILDWILTVRTLKEKKKELDALPSGLIHSDVHPHNILMAGSNVKAIVDFDAMRISQRARDVGMALYWFGRQLLLDKNDEEAREQAPKIRELFLEQYTDVRQLSAAEYGAMPWLVREEYIKKLLLVLKAVYLQHNETWKKDLGKFIMAFEELPYFWPK